MPLRGQFQGIFFPDLLPPFLPIIFSPNSDFLGGYFGGDVEPLLSSELRVPEALGGCPAADLLSAFLKESAHLLDTYG